MLKKSGLKIWMVLVAYCNFASNLKINRQMKKFAALLVVGAVAFMYACGPSAKELEEKRIADSIRVADSLAMVQAEQQRIADSIATAQAEQARKDSIAQGWLNEDGTPTAKLKKLTK
jgi:dihydroorotase-like cyclic amidohydrolase